LTAYLTANSAAVELLFDWWGVGLVEWEMKHNSEKYSHSNKVSKYFKR
jgi:hypothetical protein